MSQRTANRATFIAMGLVLLFLGIAILGNWEGMLGLALGLLLYAVALIHVPLGIVAIVAALRAGGFVRNSWIYAYFSLFALVSLLVVAAFNEWDAALTRWWEQQRDPASVALREAAGGHASNAQQARDAIAAGADIDSRDPDDSLTPLMIAARDGNVQTVRDLLDAGADVNLRARDGSTALHQAASGGTYRHTNPASFAVDPQPVRWLLAVGAEVNVRGAEDITPLLAACRTGNAEVVGLLLAAGGDLTDRTSRGDTCGTLALAENQLNFITWLANHHAAMIDLGELLRRSVRADREAAFVQLLALGAQPSALVAEPRSLACLLADDRRNLDGHRAALLVTGRAAEAFANGGYTELFWAVTGTSEQTLRNLLELGIDPDVPSPHGETVLHYIAYRPVGVAIENKARILLEQGADVDARNPNRRTPLFRAAAEGHLEMLNLLLAAGADPNATLADGTTVLREAARGGYGYIIDALAEAGAALPPAGEHGDYLVSSRKHDTSMRALLAMGFAPDTPDRRGILPVIEVVNYGTPETLAALLAAGADINTPDKTRDLPLTAAIRRGKPAIVTLLIEHGADATLEDGRRQSAVELALARRSIPYLIEFLEHGAVLTPPQRDQVRRQLLGDTFRGAGAERQQELALLLEPAP